MEMTEEKTVVDIPMMDKATCEELLDNLKSCLREYGSVTTFDLNNMLGIKSAFEDYYLGWRDLTDAYVSERDGHYRLVLPDTIVLEDVNPPETFEEAVTGKPVDYAAITAGFAAGFARMATAARSANESIRKAGEALEPIKHRHSMDPAKYKRAQARKAKRKRGGHK